MRDSTSTSLRAAMALGLAVVAPGVIEASWASAQALAENTTLHHRIVIGGFLAAVLDRVVFERMRVYGVFVHELTHAAAALLFGRRVEELSYSEQGGRVVHRGGLGGAVGDVFISLAPYVFPVFAVALVGARPLLPTGALPAWGAIGFDVLVGGVMKLQLLGSLHDFWNNWHGPATDRARGGRDIPSDLEKNGKAFSLLYVGVVALAVWGVLCAVLVNGYAGAVGWGEIVARRTQDVAGEMAVLADESFPYLRQLFTT
jgi:hypothetical protein